MQQLYRTCVIVLVSATVKSTLDVASRVPRNEGKSCLIARFRFPRTEQIRACLLLYGPYPCVRVQIWVCLICVILTNSNGAVQSWVCLKLADQETRSKGFLWCSPRHPIVFGDALEFTLDFQEWKN